jgi:hypothetical protein
MMESEITSLDNHETYSDAKSPIIPLKWVFDNKTDSAGEITQRKARIVARGDYQTFGAYGETFAPVLKPTSRNILLALAAHNGWDVRQTDFRGAYLNGVLPTPVYVEQPGNTAPNPYMEIAQGTLRFEGRGPDLVRHTL